MRLFLSFLLISVFGFGACAWADHCDIEVHGTLTSDYVPGLGVVTISKGIHRTANITWDPNICTLDTFGEGIACTEQAIRTFESRCLDVTEVSSKTGTLLVRAEDVPGIHLALHKENGVRLFRVIKEGAEGAPPVIATLRPE